MFAVLTLVVAACGGGDEGTDTTVAPSTTAAGTQAPGGDAGDGGGGEATTTQAPAATPAPGSGSSSDFCVTAAEVEDTDIGLSTFNATPAEIEATINELIGFLDQAVALAPDEIADDVAVLRQVFVDFADLLAEYEYDFFRIAAEAENDPRFLAFDTDAIEQASNNIAAYCGFEIDPDSGSSEVPAPPPDDVPDVMTEGFPDTFPEALVPPGVVSVESFDSPGLQSLVIMSEASFDEVVAFYTSVLGDPLGVFDVATGRSAAFVAEYEGLNVNISITEGDTQEIGIGIIDL